jgi:hypothetical protein
MVERGITALILYDDDHRTTWTLQPEQIVMGDVVTLNGATYRLMHVAIPPRSGNRYHLLVPNESIRWERVFIDAVTRLVDVDPRVREAVTCRSTLCELTSFGDVVES